MPPASDYSSHPQSQEAPQPAARWFRPLHGNAKHEFLPLENPLGATPLARRGTPVCPGTALVLRIPARRPFPPGNEPG